MVRVTSDSNVFISALNFRGTPARLLKLAEEAAVALQISQPILDEVSEVLERKFGWPRERIHYAPLALSEISQTVVPHVVLDVVKRDVADNRILECAQASRSDYIVTSDRDLLDFKVHEGADIINPADFLALLQQRGQGLEPIRQHGAHRCVLSFVVFPYVPFIASVERRISDALLPSGPFE